MTELLTLAQQGQGGGIAGAIFGLAYLLLVLAIAVLVIAGMWKTFAKAGQPGWGVLIPIYNLYLMCKVAGRPGWWLLLFFIPIVSIVFVIIVYIDIAKAFGKGIAFALGLIFLTPIFFCILGFGDAEYQGPAA